MGIPKLHPPPNFWFWGHLPMGPKSGVEKAPPPCVPLRGQLPMVWFWAPEIELVCGIGKGGCPAVCILGGGYERPTVCIFGRASPKRRGSHCVRPQRSRLATGMDAPLLSFYIVE